MLLSIVTYRPGRVVVSEDGTALRKVPDCALCTTTREVHLAMNAAMGPCQNVMERYER